MIDTCERNVKILFLGKAMEEVELMELDRDSNQKEVGLIILI